MHLDKDTDDRLLQIARENPDQMAMQMQRIVAMARINLPSMTADEVELVVTALGGVNLPPPQKMPWEGIASLLANRLPISEATDFIRELEPFEAFLLLVCAELASLNRQLPESILRDDAFFPLTGRDQQ